MYSQVLLIVSLLLSGVLTIPLYDSVLDNEGKKDAEILTEKGQPLELNNAAMERSTTPPGRVKESNDLIGQETFYPAGGVWWGYRPWGGYKPWWGYKPWGGYRPWGGGWAGGWGGYRPWGGHGHGWYRPNMGGQWGSH